MKKKLKKNKKKQLSRQHCYKRQHCDSAYCEASCKLWSHTLFPSPSRLHLYKQKDQAKKLQHQSCSEDCLFTSENFQDFSERLIFSYFSKTRSCLYVYIYILVLLGKTGVNFIKNQSCAFSRGVHFPSWKFETESISS